MRYKETGELHKDFHILTNSTVKYICDNFGKKALQQIFYDTGVAVYKDIREHLAKGDTSELLNFWRYFFEREEAEYSINEKNEEATLIITKCPAVEHLQKAGIEIHPEFCSQTFFINDGICAETPFEIKTEKTGEASCIQKLRKSHAPE